MNPQILGLRVAGAIFGVMSLLQLTRLLFRWKIVVAGVHLPLWPSVFACLILACLSVWLWRLSGAVGR